MSNYSLEMSVADLVETIAEGGANELIRVVEARQVKAISKIADIICGRPGIRLVLLAGASSAGKTTTAKRICTQLRVNGRPALLLSSDDYFVGDARNPRDADGKLDYEHIDCVDVPRLVADINALFRGEMIASRRFDFLKHEPYDDPSKTLFLPKGGFVVLEGIHALNPRLSHGVDDESKFRVFIEPKPSLEILPSFCPTAAESRFLRRVVRDNQFRKLNPVATLGLWPKVLEGEKKWIEPFRGNADATFDSYLLYELSVLKPYVGGLLERARREIGNHPLLVKMIRLLKAVPQISADCVPGDSILRETIGGSQLEY